MNRANLPRLSVFAAFLVLAWPLISQDKNDPATKPQNPGSMNSQNAEPYDDADAYEIYAELLRGTSESFFVIQQEITGYPDMTVKDLGINGDAAFLKEWGAAMQDYARQNRTDKRLVRNFPAAISYELLPDAEIKTIFKNGGWDRFYQRYPGSGGFYWFSAVGFNRLRTRAIVELSHSCGSLCGGGGPYFFEKKGGAWTEAHPKALVTMWAS